MRSKLSKEERLKRQNESSLVRKQQKRARGICVYGGCKKSSPVFACCYLHRVKMAGKKKLTRNKVKDYLSVFNGKTLEEKARAAREYYQAVEGALI